MSDRGNPATANAPAAAKNSLRFIGGYSANHTVTNRVAFQIKKRATFPDHTPQMTCAAPWHAGMAFALGYIKAAFQAIARE